MLFHTKTRVYPAYPVHNRTSREPESHCRHRRHRRHCRHPADIAMHQPRRQPQMDLPMCKNPLVRVLPIFKWLEREVLSPGLMHLSVLELFLRVEDIRPINFVNSKTVVWGWERRFWHFKITFSIFSSVSAKVMVWVSIFTPKNSFLRRVFQNWFFQIYNKNQMLKQKNQGASAHQNVL